MGEKKKKWGGEDSGGKFGTWKPCLCDLTLFKNNDEKGSERKFVYNGKTVLGIADFTQLHPFHLEKWIKD